MKHHLLFGKYISQLINNSSGLNKGNHVCDGVWISVLNKHRFLRFYFSVLSLVLVSIEKICQTLKTVFDHISKHLEVRQKYSAARRIFNSLLGVWSNTVFRKKRHHLYSLITTHDDFDSADPSSMQDACHMNAINSRSSVDRAPVRGLSVFALCPTLVSC